MSLVATNIRKNISHSDRFDVISQLKSIANLSKVSFGPLLQDLFLKFYQNKILEWKHFF